jgi:pimeloyl-ACP methyl ester carboxylesterase
MDRVVRLVEMSPWSGGPYSPSKAARRLAATLDQPSVVAAHSFTAIGAVVAAADFPRLVSGLVLLEPALYSLARGRAAVEEHMARMQPVFDRTVNAPLDAFWGDFLTTITGDVVDGPFDDDDLARAQRIREGGAPWWYEVPDVIGSIPTLVITGGWSADYEQIADVLEASGAQRLLLAGAGHRIQDHPDYPAAARAFAESVH